jgi:selenide,water dikinase
VSATVWLDAVPVLAAARRYVEAGIAPGGTHSNWRFMNDWVSYGEGVDKASQLLLCDAQTSGGLLVAVRPERVDDFIADLNSVGAPAAAVIGRVEAGEAARARVVLRR